MLQMEAYERLHGDGECDGTRCWCMLQVKLEVMGKKVKTCMSISGTDPQKLLREISKVEGRRVVKSTNCNDRSSRSHCMVSERNG